MAGAPTRRSVGRWTRNVEAPPLFESFFVAAVASFLGIRWFLALTGYPRIGSSELHIAHLLWGGLLMLVALMLLMAFLDRWTQHLAAVIAGLGFGAFVDEIGKYVTTDNDYFFRPAVALIYILFVVAYLAARALVGQRRLSPAEAVANAVGLLARTPPAGITADDRARIAGLLQLADPQAPLTRLAVTYLSELPGIADQERPDPSALRRLGALYARVMANPWAERALTVGVVAYAAFAVISVTLIAVGSAGPKTSRGPDFHTVAQVGSTIAGAALVGRGVLSLHASRAAAYRWFVRGVLVWILVTQVFVFYSSQLAGLGGLVIDLVAYASLRFALGRETAATPGESGIASAQG